MIHSNLVTLKLFLNAKCSLSLWSRLAFGHGKWFLNTILFLIKTFLITKFDCICMKSPLLMNYRVNHPLFLPITRLRLWCFSLNIRRMVYLCKNKFGFVSENLNFMIFVAIALRNTVNICLKRTVYNIKPHNRDFAKCQSSPWCNVSQCVNSSHSWLSKCSRHLSFLYHPLAHCTWMYLNQNSSANYFDSVCRFQGFC